VPIVVLGATFSGFFLRNSNIGAGIADNTAMLAPTSMALR
jgi:hypothetical protein